MAGAADAAISTIVGETEYLSSYEAAKAILRAMDGECEQEN